MSVQVCIEEYSGRKLRRRARPLTTHDSHSEALEAAKALVDSGLLELWHPGMPPESLFQEWTAAGEDVYLQPDDGEPKFSAAEYARMRARELAYRRRL